MRHTIRNENGTPANRRRLAVLAAMLVVVFVGLLAAMMVVGPGEAIDWVVTYLFPVGVITGVVIAALALLVQTVKRLPTSPLRDWYQ